VITYDALFFDFDGVLADTEPLHWRIWREVLLPVGIDLAWDYYERECIGITEMAMLETLGRLANPPKTALELSPLYSLKRSRFRDEVMAKPPISKETIALVQEMSGLKIAVITSSQRSEIEPILKQTKLLPLITACVYGDETAKHKPSPEPYLLAVQRTHACRPLVFEDSDPGLASARAAGLDTVRVTSADKLPEIVRRALSEANRKEP
jgi:beta-phosphoglucomutase